MIKLFFPYILILLSPECRNPYCDVFGSIYEVSDVMEADLIVYESSTEASADLIVFEQNNKLFADEEGMWFFEDNPDFVRYKIYFTDSEREAHFSVYFTRFESFAGCNE